MAYRFTELPLYPEPYYKYVINLEGQQRSFTFYWNQREAAWHFDLRNIDGTVILLGQKIVPQYPIGADYRLDSKGLTGYFALLPISNTRPPNLKERDAVPTYYQFFYLYPEVQEI